ncbi:MAG TPA: ABC transporter substrate-binding protein [Actinomycetota bacterium]|nr:ABC transporter substrate-binding protein [Actinomycetota bacterium]
MEASRREGRNAVGVMAGWHRKRGQAGMLIAVLATIALVAASCGKSSTPSTSSTPVPGSTIQPPVGTKTTGGVVTWAEAPSATPNYIFPIASSSYFSVANLAQFQVLMYRPLYWFGNNYNAGVDPDYSIGQPPVWTNNNTTVSITLNPYKWSDGETVTGRDVVFFMNLLEAEKTAWGAYVPGYFPDNVKSYTASGQTVTMTMTAPVNPTWFLYNELSQITPFPLAWDITAAGQAAPTGNATNAPDTTTAGAKAVYTFLDGLSKNLATYSTTPAVWGVVDGPWSLSSFNATTSEADFVPNAKYSGPQFGAPAATISEFKELPFTSESAELAVLKTGSANLQVGYIPAASVPQASSIEAKGYDAYTLYYFGFNYFDLNMHNPTLGPVFSQLYFRQAFQYLVNQKGWDSAYAHNTSIPTTGPMPVGVTDPFADATATVTNFPYNFDPAKAKQLLTSHGWTIPSNGTSAATCTNPGSGPNQCGAGVAGGTALSFNLDYQAGPVALSQEMANLKTEAATVGVQLQLTSHPFDQVYSVAIQCQPTDPKCSWTAENWGGGWVYSPDFEPTGEELFSTGAVSNQNNYSDPIADALIKATTGVVPPTETATDAINAYQDYIQQQVPVVYQPESAGNPQPGGLTVVSQHLGGFTANVFSSITPETYYLTK